MTKFEAISKLPRFRTPVSGTDSIAMWRFGVRCYEKLRSSHHRLFQSLNAIITAKSLSQLPPSDVANAANMPYDTDIGYGESSSEESERSLCRIPLTRNKHPLTVNSSIMKPSSLLQMYE